MSKDVVEPIDTAIVRLQSAVRERTRGDAHAVIATDVETDALMGTAARLRHAAIAHAYEGCESCALLRHLGDQEVASLLLWDALRGLPPQQPHGTHDQEAMVLALLEESAPPPALH